MEDPPVPFGRCETLVVGLTGSIATAEMPTYLRLLRQVFAQRIVVLMTASAQRFLLPEVAARFAGGPVLCDGFDASSGFAVPHIEIGRIADLVAVVPATANILAKAAHGLCDDLLSTTLVATRAPVVFFPAMNEVMWNNPVVQRNAGILRELGHRVVEPVKGLEIADLQETAGTVPPFGWLLRELRAAMRPPESVGDTTRAPEQVDGDHGYADVG
jgi:phosphopantothenoylcysteine decarboxylase/phosphopantothenate--cysteine ligase